MTYAGERSIGQADVRLALRGPSELVWLGVWAVGSVVVLALKQDIRIEGFLVMISLGVFLRVFDAFGRTFKNYVILRPDTVDVNIWSLFGEKSSESIRYEDITELETNVAVPGVAIHSASPVGGEGKWATVRLRSIEDAMHLGDELLRRSGVPNHVTSDPASPLT